MAMLCYWSAKNEVILLPEEKKMNTRDIVKTWSYGVAPGGVRFRLFTGPTLMSRLMVRRVLLSSSLLAGFQLVGF